jgi:hypothetical protein
MEHISKTAPSRFHRISGIAALGFAGAIVGMNLVMVPAGLPSVGSPETEVAAWFGGHRDLVGTASALGPAAWVLATLFGAGAVSVMWRAERERGAAWSLVGLLGITLQNAAFTGVAAVRLALAATAEEHPGSVPALWALHDALFTLNGTFLALALVGLSVGGLRSGLIARWHAGLGLVAAVLQFTSASLASSVMHRGGVLGLIGLVGWLIWVVWIVVYGVVLIRMGRAGAVVRP